MLFIYQPRAIGAYTHRGHVNADGQRELGDTVAEKIRRGSGYEQFINDGAQSGDKNRKYQYQYIFFCVGLGKRTTFRHAHHRRDGPGRLHCLL